MISQFRVSDKEGGIQAENVRSPPGLVAAEKWHPGTEVALGHLGKDSGVGGAWFCERGVIVARRALGAGGGGWARRGAGRGARAWGRLDDGDDAGGRHERRGPAGGGDRPREAL